ncbi:MAG: ASPIC/UnbV domain-containing protein [Bacteroidetes bacterium]|nr:ASPIC/UnbV domain-containing protein [Bacteroidota bacterium]
MESNRDGIGSWIEVYNNGNMFIRETHCGISYMSQNSSSLIIGAGEETTIDSIIIKWAGSGNIDILRNVDVNQTITIVEGSTITAVEYEEFLPAEFVLEQNYPNPFNPSTKIKFSLAADSKVTLKVFGILGQEVANLISGNLTAGSHEIIFIASNINSGVYFYRIDATGVDGSNFSSIKKMILMK